MVTIKETLQPIEDDPNQTQLFKQYIEDEEDEE